MMEDRFKDIKVRVPMEQHEKLWGIKLMVGQEFGATVRKALELYFRSTETP